MADLGTCLAVVKQVTLKEDAEPFIKVETYAEA